MAINHFITPSMNFIFQAQAAKTFKRINATKIDGI
jgi:hypothetical protein